MVPRTEVESACVSTLAPETSASTNSATWAHQKHRIMVPKVGLEPTHP